MDGFVDIHSHLLPGIDDGPEELDGALEMAQAAAEAGTRTIAATPHARSDFPGVRVAEIAQRCAQLSTAVHAAGIALEIVSGAETSLIWALDASDEQLAAVTYGQRGTDVLIETPSDVSMLAPLLYQVRSRGLRVTLAHPERSRVFQRDVARLKALLAQDVLLQVNAGALLGRPGSASRQLAEQLCRQGWAHVIASDGHRGHAWRPVGELAAGVEALAALVGAPRADWMSRLAPAAILNGEPLPPAPEIEAQRLGFWRRRRRSS